MRRRRAERTRGLALAQGCVPAFFVANFFSSSWLGPSNQSSLLTGRDLGTPKNFGPLPLVDRARPDASNLINFLQVKPFFSFIWPQRKTPAEDQCFDGCKPAEASRSVTPQNLSTYFSHNLLAHNVCAPAPSRAYARRGVGAGLCAGFLRS